jgi:RNA polymerase sigma factor (sigma-70 family)
MAELGKALIERLFAQHRGALRAFFNRRIKSRFDSADLVQEVYARMLRVKDKDAIRNPEGYLYTVASNLVYEHAVLSQRHAVKSEDPIAQASAAPDQGPGLEEIFDSELRAKRLSEVLLELKPKCRAAVYMKYQHGLSYEQIADHLGISPHMVQKYLGLALVHCRRRMARLR